MLIRNGGLNCNFGLFFGLLVANKAPQRFAEGHFFTSPLHQRKRANSSFYVGIVVRGPAAFALSAFKTWSKLMA
jgi:hypothetical protein